MNSMGIVFISFFLGGIVGIGAINAINITNGVDGTSAKQQCEKSLPRNQHCVLIAVPVEKEEK